MVSFQEFTEHCKSFIHSTVHRLIPHTFVQTPTTAGSGKKNGCCRISPVHPGLVRDLRKRTWHTRRHSNTATVPRAYGRQEVIWSTLFSQSPFILVLLHPPRDTHPDGINFSLAGEFCPKKWPSRSQLLTGIRESSSLIHREPVKTLKECFYTLSVFYSVLYLTYKILQHSDYTGAPTPRTHTSRG